MECKTAQTLLELYLDGELDRADARELEAHVDGCAECRSMLTRLDELRIALRDKALHYAAPPQLRERIRSTRVDADAGETAPPSSRLSRSGAPWLRIAAACVLAFGAGAVSMREWNAGGSSSSDAQLARDLFASHWRALAATSPVDVVSTDRHTVKPWFAGKVAQAPVVQDFAAQGFALVGGRIDYVGGDRVPVLVYRHGQHLIDVFVLPRSANVISGASAQGYAVRTSKLGDQSAAIVSDMDAQETRRFGELLATRPE